MIVFLSFLLLAGCNQTPTAPEIQDGQAALAEGDFSGAVQAADKALANSEGGESAARALYIKGRAIEDRPKATREEADADLREAWRNYTEALKARPTPGLEGYIRTSLANAAYWLGEYATAERQWALAYDVLTSADLKAWVLYRRGLCQQRQGMWAAADATYAAVQKEYPGTEQAGRAAAKAGARAFYVQVGAYEGVASADAVAAQLRANGFAAGRSAAGQLYRVLVGPFTRYADAAATRARMGSQYRDALIVP